MKRFLKIVSIITVVTAFISCFSIGFCVSDTQTTTPQTPSSDTTGTTPQGTPPIGTPPQGTPPIGTPPQGTPPDDKSGNSRQTQTKTSSSYFKDLTSKYSWAIAQIDFLYEKGIINGTSKDTYSPASSIKRGDYILMLYRYFKFEGTVSQDYTDVPQSSYYFTAISMAKAAGITDNTATFNPSASISRQDAIVMMYKALKNAGKITDDKISTDVSQYSDANKIATGNVEAVATLSTLKVISGSNGKFSPDNTLTRAEMAVVFFNAMRVGEKPPTPSDNSSTGTGTSAS